jgi:hypothetical protein
LRKGDAVKKYLCTFFYALLLIAFGSSSPVFSAGCETRAVWVNAEAFTSAELEKVQNARLNTLFVIAPPITNASGLNYGWSDPGQFLAFIRQAKARGLSVHAWITNKKRTGSNAQVDFTNPMEQQAQADWVISLMDTYGAYIDGVHFDYIRYSYSPINATQMAGVTATVQKAHTALKAKYPTKSLTAAVFNPAPNYASASEAVSQWFKDWFAANPGNWYQNTYGDGTNNVPEFFKEQQDPVFWSRSRNIEGIASMMYGMTDAKWNKQASAWKAFLNFQQSNLGAGILGLGWLTEEGQPDWGYDVAGIVRKIKYGRSIGFTGFSIFELGNPNVDDTPLIQALAIDSSVNNNDAPFEISVSSCLVFSAPAQTNSSIFLPLMLNRR